MVVVCLCYYCSVLVGGQLQISLKGISGDKTIKQDDNNNKQLSQSTFRHELDGGNQQSIVQQSFALIAEDGTRRLGTTQVNFLFVFFLILAIFLVQFFFSSFSVSDMPICCFFPYFNSCEFNESFHPPLVVVVAIIVRIFAEHHHHHCRHGDYWQ